MCILDVEYLRRLFLLSEFHATARPIRAKSTRLNASQLNIPVDSTLTPYFTVLVFTRVSLPFGLYFVGNSFGKSFNCLILSSVSNLYNILDTCLCYTYPLGGTVYGEEWNSSLPTDTGNLLNLSSCRLVHLSHDLQCFSSNSQEAPEVHFHLLAGLPLGDGFEFAC